jgi:triacylglycerol lipase
MRAAKGSRRRVEERIEWRTRRETPGYVREIEIILVGGQHQVKKLQVSVSLLLTCPTIGGHPFVGDRAKGPVSFKTQAEKGTELNPVKLALRRAKRQWYDVRGYFRFDLHGNDVVRRTDFTRCDRPVLLLHGFMGTRRVFDVLERRLRRDGYCVFSINLGGLFDAFNTQSIEACAEKVREKVERLYARYQLGPLSIIGHSKGGLIGRYYVKRLGGEGRVKNLITLSTPHNGTPFAYLGCATVGAVAKSVWQMTPMSPFIRRLKIGAFPSGVCFASIYSKSDRFAPFPCCILETAGQANLRNIEVVGVGHREMLFKKSVYDVVRQELTEGLGAENRSVPAKLVPLRPA